MGEDADVTSGNFTNATVIGSKAYVNASNKVRIGDVNVTVVESSAGSWTTSDARFKNNIKEEVKGLAFIKLLRPVVYNFDTKKFASFLTQNYPDSIKAKQMESMNKSDSKANQIHQSGFLAQEVNEAAKKCGYNFNGVHVPENPTDNWSLSYEKLVVPLVKAVQELSNMNDTKDEQINEQNKKIDNLRNQIDELKLLILSGNQQSMNIYQSDPVLEQNIPNPFNQSAIINYTLPAKFTSAKIIVTDNSGKTIKQFTLSSSGKGAVSIAAGTLASGLYHYTLYVDGKMADSKKMEIIK